jgi:hypothetical protein
MLPFTTVRLSGFAMLASKIAVPPAPTFPGAASTLMLPVWLMLSLA